MAAARLAPVVDAEFAEIGDQRRRDRRGGDRRAQRQYLAPLFAATLVNHVTRPETPRAQGYAASNARRGIVVNLEA